MIKLGLYNYVDYPAPCRKCGEIINNWQTKDGDVKELLFKVVPMEEVNNFYDICDWCGTWNQYLRVNGKLVLVNCELKEMQYDKCKDCSFHHSFTIDKEEDPRFQFLEPGFHMTCSNMDNKLYFDTVPENYPRKLEIVNE